MTSIMQGCSQLLSRYKIVQLCSWRFYSSNKYKKAKARKKKNDMSWTAQMIARRTNPPPTITEPSKLHMVELVKTPRGRPWWEKETLQNLGFKKDSKMMTRLIIKNTESMNCKLNTVKHLLRITPVTFPYGPPDESCDPDKCFLRDNGEFIVVRNVSENSYPSEYLQNDLVDPESSIWDMDRDTLKKHCDSKIREFTLNKEHFVFKPVYEENQDNKEYRYFGNKRFHGQDTFY